jgi:hypothetical protein
VQAGSQAGIELVAKMMTAMGLKQDQQQQQPAQPQGKQKVFE